MTVVQDSVLTSRRLIYACCMATYEARAMVDESFGRTDCAARNKKMALLMEVALDIVLGTPLSTESADDHCFTHEDACYIINKADPHCAICGCEDEVVEVVAPNPPASGLSWQLGNGDTQPSAQFAPSDNPGYGTLGQTAFLSFLTAQQWTFWMRFKCALGPGATPGAMQFLNLRSNSLANMNDLFLFALTTGDGITYPAQYISLVANVDVPGAAQNLVALGDITGALDGEWHTLAIVRNGATFYDWTRNSGIKVYIDTLPINLVDQPGQTAQNTPYALGDVKSYTVRQDMFTSNNPGQFWLIDEVYTYLTARSQSDIQNVLQPNLMEGNDATWSRLHRWRVEAIDLNHQLSTTDNNGPALNASVVNLLDPMTQLSTDTDPSLL